MSFLWAIANARHVARYGHVPEWVGTGGMMACVRCVRRGRPERLAVLVRAFRMEWT